MRVPQSEPAADQSEQQFEEAAGRRWDELRQELRDDTTDFNTQGGAADYVESENTCEVQYASTGLTLRARFDPAARVIRYDYESDSRRTAPPEHRIMSMRFSRYRRTELSR